MTARPAPPDRPASADSLPDPEGWAPARTRPVYFWAGAGTIRFQRLKFQGAPVDEAAHLDGMREEGIGALADAGFNWAFLSANWGFPVEIERSDWDEFGAAVEAAHRRGLRTLAYVQAASAFAIGSYADRDWYALTPDGRRIPYYAGRYMTCPHSPEWRDEVNGRIDRLLTLGADGIYFDNVWMGATPWVLGPAYGGFAGCACPRCAAAWERATGGPIPRAIDPDQDDSRAYLRWRADVVTGRLREWAERVHGRRPEVRVGANACAAVLRNAYVLFGIDAAAWSRVLDFVLVEDVALPRYRERRGGPPSFSQAGVTAAAARSLAAPKPVCTVSYDRGIGIDRAGDPRRYRQALAEAAAAGAIGVVKGSEYVDSHGRFSVLTAPDLAPLRTAAADVVGWLERNAGLFRGGTPAARLALIYPYTWRLEDWPRWAPGFFAAAHSLMAGGVPFRIVDPAASPWAGDGGEPSVVVVPGGAEDDRLARWLRGLKPTDDGRPAAAGPRTVVIPADFWSAPFSDRPPFAVATARRRRWLTPLLTAFHRAYFERRWVRELLHRTGLVDVGMRPPYQHVPREAGRFLARVRPPAAPRVHASVPILAQGWRREGEEQLHLVNYADAPTPVRLTLGPPGLEDVRIVSPDPGHPDPGRPDPRHRGADLELELDTYAIVIWPAAAGTR